MWGKTLLISFLKCHWPLNTKAKLPSCSSQFFTETEGKYIHTSEFYPQSLREKTMLSACLYFRIVSSPLNIEWIFKYFTLILWTFFFFNFGRNWEKIILNFSENFMMIKKMSKFHFRYIAEMKSDNLQFSTLVRWDKWLVDQASDVPSIFFYNFS